MKEFGVDSSFSRSADDEPLYQIEPVAPTAVNAIVALGGVAPMKVLVNGELQNKAGANPSERSTRHIEVQLPPISAIASAIISAWCRATIRRWWIRSRAASDFCRPTRSGCRSRRAAARNCRSAIRCRSGGC